MDRTISKAAKVIYFLGTFFCHEHRIGATLFSPKFTPEMSKSNSSLGLYPARSNLFAIPSLLSASSLLSFACVQSKLTKRFALCVYLSPGAAFDRSRPATVLLYVCVPPPSEWERENPARVCACMTMNGRVWRPRNFLYTCHPLKIVLIPIKFQQCHIQRLLRFRSTLCISIRGNVHKPSLWSMCYNFWIIWTLIYFLWIWYIQQTPSNFSTYIIYQCHVHINFEKALLHLCRVCD